MTIYWTGIVTRGQDGTQDRGSYADSVRAECRKQGIDADTFFWEWDRLKQTTFYNVYRNRFGRDKFLCYWLWKPYIIMDALINAKDGDIIAQIDTDLSINCELNMFYDLAKRNSVVVIGHGYDNSRWTTGDAFWLMDCVDDKYRHANHIWGAVHFIHHDARAMKFVHEWEICSANEELMTSQNKYMPNYPEFMGTRWLQGVETNLIVKMGIPILDNDYAGKFVHPPQGIPG